ncbi:hypothetical protein D1007_48434 [Hordeum vulgare]|nr:hypothetical protein D1007_48434 [Hordeum vulgare]
MSALTLQHILEDQTGAGKEAMIQAHQMMMQTKEANEASRLAYDASSTLHANVRKSCELGTKYINLEKEKNQLRLDLEVTTNDLNHLKHTIEGKYKALLKLRTKLRPQKGNLQQLANWRRRIPS